MLNIKNSSFNCLVDAFGKASKLADNPVAVAELKEALNSNAFRRRYIQDEPIYGQDKIIARELLARPNNGEKPFSIGNLSQTSHRLNIAREFDALTCSNALKVAGATPLTCPITLNISVDSALSSSFWEFMKSRLEKFNPDDIIFEILENDVYRNADISHLEDMVIQGYSFALDDLSIGQDHQNRLHVFGDLVDYIKIDGPLVRAGLGDENTGFTQKQFMDTIKYLKNEYSHCMLVAERAYNINDAEKLFSYGFNGVQGSHLDPKDFAYTPEASALAKNRLTCDLG